MKGSILIRNPLICATMTGARLENGEINTFSGGHIYIENGKIVSIGLAQFTGAAERVIDASRMVVLPGLINTHHHFFQTLTRNIFAAESVPLFEWLTTNYEIWEGLTDSAVEVSAGVAGAELLKTGCTTTTDHLYLYPEEASDDLLDRAISAVRAIGIRFQPTRGSMSLGRSGGGLPPDYVTQNEDAIVADIHRVVQLYHDDSPGAMIRIALAPCSPFSVTADLMRMTVQLAEEYNLQIHTHLAETLDEERFCLAKYGLRPYALLKELGWIRPNAWFAHSIYLNDEEIAEMGKIGCGVTHCPSSNMRLGSGIARIRELLSAGANVSLGVDGSASNDSSNMLLEMRNAMLLSRLREKEHWLTADEILWMATRGGAAVLGRDDIGQLAAGKCADLFMVSIDRLELAGAQHDPLAALIFCALLSPVDYVIVNGKIVVDDRKLKTIDERKIISEQQRISDELVIRAERKTGKRLRR
jgi:cytosine/adenosine deaminase-related metal-dependent hydrolase